MKYTIPLTLLAVVSGLVPAVASANAFVNARFEVEEDDILINLVAQEEIGQPRVRTDAGQVRVWFPGMADDVRLDPVADGGALRAVRVRPGVNGSSVVIIRLGDGRTLSAAVVRVERNANHATIRIARSALPPVEELEGDAELAELTADDVTEEVEAPASEPEESAAPPALNASRPAAAGPLGAGSGSNLGVMALITILLALGYLAIRFFRSKGKVKSPLDEIEIVASRRLGTKHQIVLVRALGEDHLLSVNGNQTQRIASTPTAVSSEPSAAERRRNLADEAIKPGVLSRLQAHLRKSDADDEDAESEPTPKKNGEERFGSELLRYAIDSERPRRGRRRPRAVLRPQETSESVQGLVALRERLAQ
ncbi:MAG: flagellar biosynthetic protein FliO [Myxococcota bacterium]